MRAVWAREPFRPPERPSLRARLVWARPGSVGGLRDVLVVYPIVCMLLRRSSFPSTSLPSTSHPARPSASPETLPATVAVPTDSEAAVEVHPTPRLTLSTTQVVGSAVAAAGSAVAASSLGVAGTIIGAVLGSLVMTIGSALVAHSLKFAGFRLRLVRVPSSDAAPGGPTTGSVGPPIPDTGATLPLPSPRGLRTATTSGSRPDAGNRSYAGRRLAVGIVAGAAVALGGITAYELVTGHSVSSGNGSGTTLGGVVAAPQVERTAPTPSRGTSPTTVPTTPLPTATVTVTVPPTTPPPSATTAPPTSPVNPTVAPTTSGSPTSVAP